VKHQVVARPRLVYWVPVVVAILMAIIFGVQMSRAANTAAFKSMRLSDEDRIYTVATRTGNGSLALSHVVGKTAAEQLVKQGTPATIGKEVRRER